MTFDKSFLGKIFFKRSLTLFQIELALYMIFKVWNVPQEIWQPFFEEDIFFNDPKDFIQIEIALYKISKTWNVPDGIR